MQLIVNNDDRLKQMPFNVLVMIDMAGTEVASWNEPTRVTKGNLNSVIQSLNISIQLGIQDPELLSLLGVDAQYTNVEYPITKFEDFIPYYLINNEPHLRDIGLLIEDIGDILQLPKNQMVLDINKYPNLNLNHVKHITKRNELEQLKLNLESVLSRTIDSIIHAPNWQKAEASWRSIYWLLEESEEASEVNIDLLLANRDLLWDDLVRSGSVVDSDLYHLLYQKQMGQYGAAPYALILNDDYFNASGQDTSLLSALGQLGQLLHAPVVTAVNAEMLGTQHWKTLLPAKDISELFSTVRYLKYRSLLQAIESQYLVLTLPRIKLRNQFDQSTALLPWYKERRSSENKTLFGNASFAFAINLIKSFAKNGLCTEITGKDNGAITPMFVDENNAVPVEVMFSEIMENTLTNLGFTPICSLKSSATLYFQSANSIHWGSYYLSNQKISTDNIMSCNISFLTIALRFAHNIKTLFRDELGNQRSATSIQASLNRWLQQYVSDVETPAKQIMAKRPLRQAGISIAETEEPGWFDLNLTLVPHFSTLNKKASIDLNMLVNSAI